MGHNTAGYSSWSKAIEEVCNHLGEEVVSSNPDMGDESMTKEFDFGYGGTKGVPFVAFTENYVLFPLKYDGSEWVGCVPRNPVDWDGNIVGPTKHHGG